MQDSSPVVIYGLCDPRTGELRYVGKSHKPDFRLYIHIWDAKNRPRTRLHTWIRSLVREDVEPEQFIIEECGEDWIEAEVFWIGYFRFIGCDLVNHTNGGEGLWNPTPEVRAKMSEAHKGYQFTEERKAEYSEKFRGEANPYYGKQHSEAARAKISAALTGKRSPKKGKPAPAGCWEPRLKTYVVTSPEGEEIVVGNLPRFCAERGLTRSNMVTVASGKWPHHKGWKCRRLEDAPVYEASGQLGFRFEE